jgi:hypothetical protein
MVVRVRSTTAAHDRRNVSDTDTTVHLRNMQPGYQCNINSYCTTRFAQDFLRRTSYEAGVLPGAIGEDARYLVRKSGKHPIYEVRDTRLQLTPEKRYTSQF